MNTIRMSSSDQLGPMQHKSGRWVTVAILGLLFSVVAMAQPGGRGAGGRGEAGFERGQHRVGPQSPGASLKRMERLLDLSEDQVSQLEAIFQQHHAEGETSRDDHRANREALREELAKDNPDALSVGELMIAGKELREASEAAREDLQQSVAEVLTEEQLAKWEGFQRGRNADRRGSRRGPERRRGPGQGQ